MRKSLSKNFTNLLGLGLGHFGITQGQWVKELNDFKIGKKFEGLERKKNRQACKEI